MRISPFSWLAFGSFHVFGRPRAYHSFATQSLCLLVEQLFSVPIGRMYSLLKRKVANSSDLLTSIEALP